jgi:uncharacterized protein (DUF1810 family)
MWYIFPQLIGLGSSETAHFYGIENRNEATTYLQHPILGPHLIEISSVLLQLEGKKVAEIYGTPDDLKLRSYMTLFAKVLKKYIKGKSDERTLQLLNRIKL